MSRFSDQLKIHELNPWKPGSLGFWFNQDKDHKESLADIEVAYKSGHGMNAATIHRIMLEAYPTSYKFKLDTLRDFLKEYYSEQGGGDN